GFYCYAAPSPSGLEAAVIRPREASFNPKLGEFLYRYEDMRQAPSPDDALLQFLESTYSAAADLAQWDRKALERGRS
ncbi:MAG TPA: DUF5996 family protein, partial [Granulicella sp.]|nr:DUF5996 family protein [Granulicella sp.]